MEEATFARSKTMYMPVRFGPSLTRLLMTIDGAIRTDEDGNLDLIFHSKDPAEVEGAMYALERLFSQAAGNVANCRTEQGV